MSPIAGHVGGGIRVTLSGARFGVYGGLADARCRFGADVVAAIAKNDSRLVCVLPPTSQPRDPDRHPTLFPIRAVETVAASVDGGASWSRADPDAPVRMQRYDAAVSHLTPTSGPLVGGDRIRVHGAGLLAVPRPASRPGRGGNQSSSPSAAPPLSSSRIAASSIGAAAGAGPGGDAAGEEDALCAFGADVRPATRRTSGWIECVVPPAFMQLPSGAHDLDVPVRVSLRGDDFVPDPASPAARLRFAYYGEPSVRTLAPLKGPLLGGTRVVITGDFPTGMALDDVRCRFGGQQPVHALAASASAVRCDAPPLAGGVATTAAAGGARSPVPRRSRSPSALARARPSTSARRRLRFGTMCRRSRRARPREAPPPAGPW